MDSFYHFLKYSDEKFRTELSTYPKMSDEDRIAFLDIEADKEGLRSAKGDYDQRIRKILRNFKSDSELGSFLTKNIDILHNIIDWNIYRRATEISTSPLIKPKRIEQEDIELLKSGNIREFNHKRLLGHISSNLRGADQ